MKLKRIISLVLMIVIALNTCLVNLPIKAFASEKNDIKESLTVSEDVSTVKNGIVKGIQPEKMIIKAKIEDEEPAFHEITLKKGTNYEIINNDYETLNMNALNFSDYQYDLVKYNQDKSISSYYKDDFGHISIKSKSSVKLTIKDNDLKFYIPYKQFENIEIKEIKTKALYEFKLEPSKNYELHNDNEVDIRIENTSSSLSRYNIVTYKQDGGIRNFYKDDDGSIQIYNKSKTNIGVVSNVNIECWIPYDYKDKMLIKEIEEPVLYEFKLEKGKNYEIDNNYTNEITIKNLYSTNRYDIVYYKSDGSIKNSYQYIAGDIHLLGNEKVLITPKNDTGIKCWLPSDYKNSIQIKETENKAIYRFDLEVGKYYEIENVGSNNLKVSNSSSYNDEYDIMYYNLSSEIKNINRNAHGIINIQGGEKIRINVSYGNNIKCGIPYEQSNQIRIKELETPILYEGKFEKNKSYEIKNKSYEKIDIYNTSSSDFRYEIVHYDKNGNIKKSSINDRGTIELLSEEKVIITTKKNYIEFWTPYENKEKISINETDKTALNKTILEANKTYEITNNLDTSIGIENNSTNLTKFNVVKYNSDGKISTIYYKKSISKMYLEKGMTLKVSVLGDKNVEVVIPTLESDKIPVKEVSTQAVKDWIFKQDKIYEITNTGEEFYIRNNGDSKFDVVSYRPDGSVINSSSNTSGNILIGKGRRIRLTPLDKDMECWSAIEQYENLEINEFIPDENNTLPTINANDIVIKVGDIFDPLKNVSAYDEEDGDITKNIVVAENTVNTNAVGVYKVIYEVEDSKGKKGTKEIKVTVNPKLSLINSIPKINAKDVTIKVGDKFDPKKDVSATDKEDGNLTSNMVITNKVNTSKVGTYDVIYKVTDSKGARATKTIKVTVRSNEKPVITAKDITIRVGDKFDYKKGISVSDKEDGNLTSKIVVSGKVDTSKGGKYTIKYEVTDKDGNKVTKSIKVTVLNVFKSFEVNSVNKTSKIISGKGLKGSTVKAYVNGKQIGKTVTVDSKGNYKITIPAQKLGAKVVVKMSKTGYSTIEKITTVLNTFSTFVVDSIKKTSTSISGKGLKEATVKAYVNGKQIGKTAKVDSKGNYKISIPKQKANTKVVVKMSKSGYTTSEKSTTVLDTFSKFTVNSIKSTSKTITGKGLKGATVKVYVKGKQIGKTVNVDSKGNYKISISKQKTKTKVVVKMIKSGYAITEKTIIVKR